jgi:hypothetical protein
LKLSDAIETERPIQEQIQTTNFDIIISKKILNFQTPPPVIRPALEIVDKKRLLIVDLIAIFGELQSLANLAGLIESKDLLKYLVNLMKYKPLRKTFPGHWQGLGQKDFEYMITVLDKKTEGQVSLRFVMTAICLQNSPVPTERQIEEYKKELTDQSTDGWISKEKFVGVASWFDETQLQLKVHERSNRFDRVKNLKTLLFEINGNLVKVRSLLLQNKLEVSQLLNTLSCAQLETKTRDIKTYFDVFFAKPKGNKLK